MIRAGFIIRDLRKNPLDYISIIIALHIFQMALSKSVVPESLQVIPDIGQHYVECAIEMLILLQKPKKRKIEPMDTDSKVLKATEKETKQVKEKYEVNETLSLSSFITKVKEFTVPHVCNVFHISLGNSGRIWAINNAGSLLQPDLPGNFLEKIKTRGGAEGYHAVTQDGDLLYADKTKKCIKRLTIDKKNHNNHLNRRLGTNKHTFIQHQWRHTGGEGRE